MSESPQVSTKQFCQGTTKAGKPCRNYALADEPYCRLHQPAAAPAPETQNGTSHTHIPLEEEDPTPEQLFRQRLQGEVGELVERLNALTPAFVPPPFQPEAILSYTEKLVSGLPRHRATEIIQRANQIIREDAFDPETWRGLWYLVNYNAQYQLDIIKRRFTGDYEVDEWGLDWEFLNAIMPFLNFMYRYYFRTSVSGFEHIPDYTRGLVVCNHSGQLPFDGGMVMTAIYQDHPSQRLLRSLYASWFPTLPFISSFLEKGGQVMACVENGTRLLEQDQLVGVFPEGYKGVGKLFSERYKLARFGRGGFIKMALNTGAPIIPTAIVGAEETYVSIYKSDLLARVTGFPYFPISLRFPWLGLLGFIPFPTKWFIDFGEPIPTDHYPAGSANNMVLVSQLTNQTRNIIQEMINDRLAMRRSVFFG